MKGSSLSRSDQSFSGSDAFQMSLLTSKLADKEKRIEEYKELINGSNASYEVLKVQINQEQGKLTDAQHKNKELRQMLNYLLQTSPAADHTTATSALLL